MSYSLEITAAAEADLREAIAWYEQARKGLGDDFLLCVDEALARILRYPLSCQPVKGDVRRLLIHRFPYGIFFRIRDNRISVTAVFHSRRQPKIWQSR